MNYNDDNSDAREPVVGDQFQRIEMEQTLSTMSKDLFFWQIAADEFKQSDDFKPDKSKLIKHADGVLVALKDAGIEREELPAFYSLAKEKKLKELSEVLGIFTKVFSPRK